MLNVAPPLLSVDTALLLAVTLVNLYIVLADEGDWHGACLLFDRRGNAVQRMHTSLSWAWLKRERGARAVTRMLVC
jgi:hypothetical protein